MIRGESVTLAFEEKSSKFFLGRKGVFAPKRIFAFRCCPKKVTEISNPIPKPVQSDDSLSTGNDLEGVAAETVFTFRSQARVSVSVSDSISVLSRLVRRCVKAFGATRFVRQVSARYKSSVDASVRYQFQLFQHLNNNITTMKVRSTLITSNGKKFLSKDKNFRSIVRQFFSSTYLQAYEAKNQS